MEPSNGHVEHICAGTDCPSWCPYCDGGLFYCTVCQGAEGTLTKECPGVSISNDDQELIMHGLDYWDGKWQSRPTGKTFRNDEGSLVDEVARAFAIFVATIRLNEKEAST